MYARAEGTYAVEMGRVKPKTTLPAQFWPALLATGRLYTEQEIATLRTAIPMLQFARAGLSQFSDHGPGHALRVKSYATQMGYVVGLSKSERFLLRAGALFHDIGNVVDRRTHHIISQETVEKLTTTGSLPFDSAEAQLIGLLCRWHRREYDPKRIDTLHGEQVRTGLLASILRVCDAMDIDHRRSDYDEKFRSVLEFFYEDQLPYWTSLEEIAGLRVRCTPEVAIQVYTWGEAQSNMQIEMLRNDLASTPLPWSVEQIPVVEQAVAFHDVEANQRALLVFPFDAHSLVMASLSRSKLQADGCAVELLCYPDTVDGSLWLWEEALSDVEARQFDKLVTIGDRFTEAATEPMLKLVKTWLAAGTDVTVLNRYEATWSRGPALLEMGAEIFMGGDWAYFWGTRVGDVDLAWGRIAALGSRDPTQATETIPEHDRQVSAGLLHAVFAALEEGTAQDTTAWVELAEPILDRIAANDQDYFANQAAAFYSQYAKPLTPYKLRGNVAVFQQAPGKVPQAYYWILEQAIEEQGIKLEHSIRFEVPYAVASWRSGDEVELLAINHWREEEAIPVRFLYPDFAPAPSGNESTIYVRLSPLEADTVVAALIRSCNERA